jgi:hypothetical protein
VGVNDDIWINVSPVRVPGLRANKAIGNSNRQSLRSLAHLGEGGLVVLVQVGDAVLGLTEVVKSRQRLVDQGDSVAAAVGLAEDVVGGSANHLDREIEGGLVVPPGELTSLTLVVETVLTARKTVQVNEDVHVVLTDGILSNLLHCQLLTTGVVVVTSNGRHVRPVTDRDTESVDAICGKVVDILGGNVGLIAVLEQSAALHLAQSLAETVLVDGAGCIVVEEARLNVLLKNEPTTKVDTVRFVVPPSRERIRCRADPLGAGPVDDDFLNLNKDLRSDLEEVDKGSSRAGRAKKAKKISLGKSRGVDWQLGNVIKRQSLGKEIGRGQELVAFYRIGGEKSRAILIQSYGVNDLRWHLDRDSDVYCSSLGEAGSLRDILGRADQWSQWLEGSME